MNMFKSNGGFTLVELIVVIAILAILAGIAVPAYSGYIKKAEQAADLQFLSTVNTAAQGLAAAKSATVTSITVTDNTVAVVTNPADAVNVNEVYELLGGTTGSDAIGDVDYVKAVWSNTDNKWAITYTESTPSNPASGSGTNTPAG